MKPYKVTIRLEGYREIVCEFTEIEIANEFAAYYAMNGWPDVQLETQEIQNNTQN